VTEPDDTYSAAVIEEALLAAATVAERVYEVAPDISPAMEGAFRGLAESVFRWTEGLDLQQELADEGARAGAVADLADPTYATSYAVTVHQVLTVARAVQEATAREPDSLPASAVPLLDRLGSAVGEWERQPDAAARWWEEGGRPALIHPVGAAGNPVETNWTSAQRCSPSLLRETGGTRLRSRIWGRETGVADPRDLCTFRGPLNTSEVEYPS
jgi:hypothetical protein